MSVLKNRVQLKAGLGADPAVRCPQDQQIVLLNDAEPGANAPPQTSASRVDD